MRAARAARACCVAALALVLAAPGAAPALGHAQTQASGLRGAIASALHGRSLRFNRAESAVSDANARLRGECAGVQGAGGDVTAVLSFLALSDEALAEAVSTEADAATQFAAVPDAPDRRAAFAAARETARRAVGHLRNARQLTLRAAAELTRVCEGLRAGSAP
ncbi:hypothetical protein FDZ71_16185 [bacterium]|nr:MAG: hypothetical protein FDZ71_16185 [bacterium]